MSTMTDELENGEERSSVRVDFVELYTPAEIAAATKAWERFEPTKDNEGLLAALNEIVTDKTLARIRNHPDVGPSIANESEEVQRNMAAGNLATFIGNRKAQEMLRGGLDGLLAMLARDLEGERAH